MGEISQKNLTKCRKIGQSGTDVQCKTVNSTFSSTHFFLSSKIGLFERFSPEKKTQLHIDLAQHKMLVRSTVKTRGKCICYLITEKGLCLEIK